MGSIAHLLHAVALLLGRLIYILSNQIVCVQLLALGFPTFIYMLFSTTLQTNLTFVKRHKSMKCLILGIL